jgi:hypothetical protein
MQRKWATTRSSSQNFLLLYGVSLTLLERITEDYHWREEMNVAKGDLEAFSRFKLIIDIL